MYSYILISHNKPYWIYVDTSKGFYTSTQDPVARVTEVTVKPSTQPFLYIIFYEKNKNEKIRKIFQ
jgi:hypothetical protein